MNFQDKMTPPPLKVLVVNPLTPSGQMITVKILSGFVFGENQLIDLILLVYFNEKAAAERLKVDLVGCAYSCYNTVVVSSDLPSISDADVFCFLSNFYNLNKVEINNMDTDEQFDALYLIIKIANNFAGLETIKKEKRDDDNIRFKYKGKQRLEIQPRKPIFMTDGLVAMDILVSLSKNISPEVFFCPTPIPDIAKSVLAEYLKVRCNVINDVRVWAANDEIFHVEVEKPLVIHDQADNESHCDWDMVGKKVLQSFDLDHTQFSPSWMKKEFIEKVTISASKNPYGCIFRASLFARALKSLWKSRTSGSGEKFYCNIGVISDGSLNTAKGYPYVLPIVFSGDSWSVNNQFEESTHLRNEIKRITKAVKKHHQTLIPFCKRFLQENVINQAFIPVKVESSSLFSTVSSSKPGA